MTTIAERVAAGAAFLDERKPGWWKRINLDTLDIYSCTACVIGQLGMADEGHENPFDPDLGFDKALDAAPGMAGYRALNRAWRRVIEARRAAS